MNKFECILEEWDDRVCRVWGAASTPFLSPDDWLIHNETYKNRELLLRKNINRAFHKVNEFFTSLDPILNSYWENRHIDFNLCSNRKL
jgi:hypothetical protein